MKPHTLETYQHKYETIQLERTDDGVLTVRLHDHGDPTKPLQYASKGLDDSWIFPQTEWSHCFYDVARDPENEVVIITGAGDQFIGEGVPFEGHTDASMVGQVPPTDPHDWEWIRSNGIWLQMNLLSIEVPVIGAVNGPALTHAELATQSDIVICSDNTVFQDSIHFPVGLHIPGDGAGLHWPELLGATRGQYFLLTGQKIDAKQALDLGIVNEVLPSDGLMPRAIELAREILRRPRLDRRYTRLHLTQPKKMRMLEHLGHGLALEGLAGAGRRLTGQ